MKIGGLAVVAAAWVAVLAVVAHELLRTRPLPARRRMLLYGLSLTSTTTFASVFVESVGWPHSQRSITHLVLVLVATAGLALALGSQVNRDRRNRLQRRSPVPSA
jgi:hypothetical protein